LRCQAAGFLRGEIDTPGFSGREEVAAAAVEGRSFICRSPTVLKCPCGGDHKLGVVKGATWVSMGADLEVED